MFGLRDYQFAAIRELHDGCILCGGVGSGKSRTAIAYYFDLCGGDIYGDEYEPMWDTAETRKDLYIITTARKRDTLEWDDELVPFHLSTSDEMNRYKYHHVVIDSWNNIHKYKDVEGAFFIFDEQRVVGYGKWSKTFIKISRRNNWILLSATPGDTWSDYIPVFIANGFYANKTEFEKQHVIWKRFSKFPQIDRYDNVGRLIRLRNAILVDMDFQRQTVRHHNDIFCEFDRGKYKQTIKSRFNPYTNEPILNAGELCYTLRRIVNEDQSRIDILKKLVYEHGRVIVFYNYDYELDILRSINYGSDVAVAEWNGHRHELIPKTKKWVYLVQYTAGCEGWNCIETNAVIFYSQTYSYKQLEQACGRIDRLNTPYIDLYYYHLRSKASIDLAINGALNKKKKFNERKWCEAFF